MMPLPSFLAIATPPGLEALWHDLHAVTPYAGQQDAGRRVTAVTNHGLEGGRGSTAAARRAVPYGGA
jgi:hypothetical protein